MVLQKWGGKDEGLSLADCCLDRSDERELSVAQAVSSVHFQYYSEDVKQPSLSSQQQNGRTLQTIHIDNVR